MRLFTRVLPTQLASLLSGCGYNAIQQKDEAVKASWSEVLNQYKRRADLVPNLVQTVKGFASQEERVLTEVTNARSRVGQINVNADDEASLKQFQQAQGELGSAPSRLLVVTENYPVLKSDQNFRDLQAQLEGTENRITVARGATSSRCRTTTLHIRSFPQVVTAKIFGYKTKPNFTVDNEAQISNAPAVDFGNAPQQQRAAAGSRPMPGHCAAGPAAVAAVGNAGTAAGADSCAGLAGGRYHRHAGRHAEAGAGAAAIELQQRGQPAAGAVVPPPSRRTSRSTPRGSSINGRSAARAWMTACCWWWPRMTGACASSRATALKAPFPMPSPTG